MSDPRPKADKTVRWYQTIPGRCWSVDSVLNAVSWEAEYLFRRIVDNVNFDWRFEFPPDGMENRIRGLCFSPERRSRAWPASKVARHVGELLATGIVRRLEHGGRCWLEVAERLQYVKGQNAAAGPPGAEQEPLDLPPTLFPLPPADDYRASQEAEKLRAALSAGVSANAVRKESEEKIQNDSGPDTPAVQAQNPKAVSGLNASPVNRFLERGRESGKDYSRTMEQLCATPLGRRLRDWFGTTQVVVELKQSGAEWLRIIRDEADWLAELLEQGERSRTTLTTGKARAVWLTEHLHERRRVA